MVESKLGTFGDELSAEERKRKVLGKDKAVFVPGSTQPAALKIKVGVI